MQLMMHKTMTANANRPTGTPMAMAVDERRDAAAGRTHQQNKKKRDPRIEGVGVNHLQHKYCMFGRLGDQLARHVRTLSDDGPTPRDDETMAKWGWGGVEWSGGWQTDYVEAADQASTVAIWVDDFDIVPEIRNEAKGAR